MPMTLNRFMDVDYRGACFQVSSAAPSSSGLVFIAATNDRIFRAFDARTGKNDGALNHRGHSISEGWAAAPCHRHA